jgi:hypothetical protein
MSAIRPTGIFGKHDCVLLRSIVNDDQGGNRNPHVGFDFNMASLVVSMSVSAFITMSLVVDDTTGHKNTQCKYQANPQAAGRGERSFGGGTVRLLRFGKKHN